MGNESITSQSLTSNVDVTWLEMSDLSDTIVSALGLNGQLNMVFIVVMRYFWHLGGPKCHLKQYSINLPCIMNWHVNFDFM